MAIDSGIFNTELEGWLRAKGFSGIKSYDEDGNPITYKNTEEKPDAVQYRFTYSSGGKKWGDVIITTNNGDVVLFFDDSVISNTKEGAATGWPKFVADLKNWVFGQGGSKFSVKNLSDYGPEMKKRKSNIDESRLLEGYYGNKNTSYSDGIPKIKLIIKHSKSIEEGDQRYHHIEKIFLENELGERILVPSKKPSIGRAFARHLAEGGQYNDERWAHIKEMAEDIGRLGGFVRATRIGEWVEPLSTVINEATGAYESLRSTIKRLQTTRGYNQYFTEWKPNITEIKDESNFLEMFVSNVVDPRIERAIPTLTKLGIHATEVAESIEFTDWANNIVEGLTQEEEKSVDELAKLLSDSEPLTVGPNAINAIGVLDPLLDDGKNKNELFAELELLSRGSGEHNGNPDYDAKPAIEVWLQRHAEDSSDNFYSRVLGKIDMADDSGEKIAPKAKPPAPTAPVPGAVVPPAPLEEDSIDEQKNKSVKIRNFVAKHAQKSGAGKHGKSGYARHVKHKKKLGEDEYGDYEENPVATAIRGRIVRTRIDLLKQYGLDKVSQAVDDIASGVSRVSEIGSSDVSGWVKQVEDWLHRQDTSVDAPMEAVNEHLLAIKKLSGIK